MSTQTTQISIPIDTLHALMPHTLREPMQGAGEGSLSGLSFMVKDLFAVEGHKTSDGNADLYAIAEPAKQSAAAIRTLLAAGASLTGITICDEFFYSLLGTNAHYGAPINPKAPSHVTGGSSCGSAAAVAGGMCDFALGSDTGGSTRIPASFCGLFGLRPSHGRISLEGGTAMAPSYDTAGILAREPELLRRVGTVLLDRHPVAAEVTRLVLPEDLFAIADPHIGHAVKGALTRFSRKLPPPERLTTANGELDAWRDAFRVIQGSEVQQTLLPLIRKFDLRLGPGIGERFQMAAAITPDEVAKAQAMRVKARARLTDVLTPGTILAFPTAPTLPPPAGVPDGPDHAEFRTLSMQCTCLAGHAGLPQLSMPVGEVEGCPVGLSFLGWAGGDEALLKLAVKLAA